MVVPAVTVAPLNVPPESVTCEFPVEASRVVPSLIVPPESTNVLPPLMRMLRVASPPGVLSARCVTVAPLLIWTSSVDRGVCPRLQQAIVDQSALPPTQALVIGVTRSSNRSRCRK